MREHQLYNNYFFSDQAIGEAAWPIIMVYGAGLEFPGLNSQSRVELLGHAM